MRKILLGSTALLGFGLLSASAAAQVELSISGNVRFQGAYVDEDDDDGAERDYDFSQQGELQFNANGVADNGLEYGAENELDDIASEESGDDVEVDEQWGFIGGDFGQVRFGHKEGAAKEFSVTAPADFATGGCDGDYGDFMLGSAGSYLLDLEDAVSDEDNTKVTYITPELGGFQGGISFAPTDNAGKSGAQRRAADSDAENIFTVGGNYAAEFEGFDVLVGAGRSEEHTSELQSLMRISYAAFCLKKKKHHIQI